MTKRRKREKGTWAQGLFTPIHPEKYKGNVDQIVFRSSWELSFADFLDKNQKVIQWSSEELSIQYYNPIKKRMAQYYPDFLVKYIDESGKEQVELIEIKPHNQVTCPKNGTPEQKNTWIQNMAKWDAAIKYCKTQQIKFRVLTEKSLKR